MDGLATTPETTTVAGDAGAPPAWPTTDEISAYLSQQGSETPEGGEPTATQEAAPDVDPSGEPADAPEIPADEPEATGAAATGGDTPSTDNPRTIPYTRFQEVIQERNTAREQLEQLQTIAAFQPVIERFQEMGVTRPEHILAALDRMGQAQEAAAAPPQPEPEPEPEIDPADALAQYWSARGVDVFEASAEEYARLEALYQTHQEAVQARTEAERIRAELNAERMERARVEQERQEAEQRAAEERQLAQWQQELATVTQQFPQFAAAPEGQTNELREALIARWAAAPEGVSLQQVATSMVSAMETQYRNKLASDAVQKAQAEQKAAAARPQVPGGGGSPSPAVQPDFVNMSNSDLEKHVMGVIAAQGG